MTIPPTDGSRTFLFMPESAYGPTNNCIGIAGKLQERGHRIVFAVDPSWAGKLSYYGFEEQLVDLTPPEEDAADATEQDSGDFWKEYIREISPEFRKPTLDQIGSVVKGIWEGAIDEAKYCEPRLREIVRDVSPDVVIEDNVVCFPALVTGGPPFVRIVSCNPLEIPGQEIAPAYSGLAEDDRTGWAEYRKRTDELVRPLWNEYNDWVQQQGAPPLPEMEFIHSGAHNLYLYPDELDYVDRRPLGPAWTQLDSAVRQIRFGVDLPDEVKERFGQSGRPLIYFSLGSLGGADVDLMRQLISELSTVDANIVVSKGPRADELELADNMWGEEMVAQTRIIPHADLVITHGGNNTVTESMHAGKPMILLPLFWDQYDNAQRVHERGYGIRVDTYAHTPDQMHEAIDTLLRDQEMRDRCARAGDRIRQVDGLSVAADTLERVAQEHSR